MILKNSPKVFNNYKSDIPENTIKRIEEGISVIGLDLKYNPFKRITGLGVFSGRCIVSRSPFYSFGKGTTPVLSKASAYAEAAERISSGGFFLKLTHLPKRKDLFSNVNFDEDLFYKIRNYTFLKGYSYKDIDDGLRKIYPEQFIPIDIRQDEDRKILLKSDIAKFHWVTGYSLTNNEKVKIPVKFVSKIGGTNGTASGNTLEEAITQGLSEVIERYCYFKIMYDHISVPTIDPDTISCRDIKDQISFYNKNNIDVIIKDFSLGGKFPVVGVILIDHNLEKTDNRLKKDIFYCQVNAGAALNLTEAVLRCLTERRQTPDPPEKLFINSGPDIIWKHWVLNMKKTYGKAVSIHNSEFRSYLTDRDLSFLLDGDAPMVSFEYLRKSFPRNSDFRDDVDYFTDLLKKENEELIVIDVQHPGIKFPAVWVIVPGMMWMRKSLINEDTVFLKYSLDDSWFEDADKIKSFIRTAEDYLKYNLYFPDVDTVFGTKVSLFRILAVCNFKIEKYDEALQYFEAAREVEGTSKYDVVISKLRNRDSIPANDAVLMKNPFVYGWDVEENALNMVIIPREVNRVMSCFYRHFAS